MLDLKAVGGGPAHLAAIAGKVEGDAAFWAYFGRICPPQKLAIADHVLLSVGLREIFSSPRFCLARPSWLRELGSDRAGVYRRLLDVPLRCPFHVPLLIANCSFDQQRLPRTRRQRRSGGR